MRKSTSMLLSWLLGVAAVTVASASFAAGGEFGGDAVGPGNVANGKTIFTQGKGAAAPCMTCHGDHAQGNDAMGTPRLANQGQAYIVKQLTDFAAGRRVPTGLGAAMPGFAKALSAQDRHDVAAYVSSIPRPMTADGRDKGDSDLNALAASGTKIGKAYEGKILVRYGVMAADHPSGAVPACQSCHQYNGRGAFPMFPMIGQQKYTYLVKELHDWRANAQDIANGFYARTNDPDGMMRAVAKNLTDEDIVNVATYLATAPVTSNGAPQVPEQE